VNLTARTIGVEVNPSTSRPDSLLLSQANLDQLANSAALSLKAMAGPVTFYCNVDFEPGPVMKSPVIDAPALMSTCGSTPVRVGGAVALLNSGSASLAATAGAGGTFEIDAAEIDLSGGAQGIGGFRQINWTASNRVFVGASGALTLGSGFDAVDL